MNEPPAIEINSVPIQWDLEKGTFTFFGLNSALFWINPSLLTMLQPLADEVGIDLFRLLIAHSSSQGTEEDYQSMVTVLGNTFEEGFLNWGKAVSSAGWGTFEILHFDSESKKARVRVSNSWELLLNCKPEKAWGCPFIQGKIIGIFSHAFKTECWADEINISYLPEDSYVVFDIYESDKTILDEIKKIRFQRQNEQEKALTLEVEKKTTELRKTHAILKKSTEAAEFANQAKSQFLATMSHELRTPMTGVLGFADMLLDEELSQKNREMVKQIKDASNSLLRVLNDILDMSKIEAGKMDIEYIDFNLRNLVTEVVKLFRISPSLAESVNLNVSLSKDFPDVLKSDPTRIRQVLVNLIGNALKFTNQGHVNITGNLISTDGQSFVKVSIEDTGIGIPKEMLRYLFEAFTQADTSISRKYEGTGLGLAVCKSLCHLLGGEIGVESEEGRGSRFWFIFPFQAATTDVVANETAEHSNYKALRQINILIAEDNPVNQIILANLMKKMGHSVTIVINGEEATKAHSENDFDLILMDIRMPVMNGPEATRVIRQMPGSKSKIHIIACTADAITENISSYYESGIDGFISKPVDRQKIFKVINEIMGEEIHVPVK